MTAPQELWIFHQSVLNQLIMEQLVHVHLEAVLQLERQSMENFIVQNKSEKITIQHIISYYYIV